MASRKRFTDKQIKALKARGARYAVWEGGGFGVRVTPRGMKSWIWLYRYHGKPRRMTLGTYPSMGLRDARVVLATAQKDLERGEDPGATAVKQRSAERLAETVSELIDQYLKRHASKKRSGDEDKRILNKDVRPSWGTRKAKAITRQDVTDLLDSIIDRGAPIMANRTLAVTRRMFNWGMRRGVVEVNPAAQAEPPGQEMERTRILDPEEIRSLWNGLDGADMHPLIRLALKFQLVVAQRKGEIVRAKEDHFDIDDAMWTIPAEDTKNKRPHRVPLSPLAVSIYEEIRELSDGSPMLFPSPLREDQTITGRAVSQALLTARETIGVENVTPHDLRRTASTGMASLGVPKFIREKVLNHSQGKLDKAYDQYEYDDEKRDALERWADRLAVVLSEDQKVVALK